MAADAVGVSSIGGHNSVWARPGRLSALSVLHSKSVVYGSMGRVWARRALNRPKRRFPAPAGQWWVWNSYIFDASIYPLMAAQVHERGL